MTVVSDQAPVRQDHIMRRLADLERQVRELTAGRRMEAATIKGGSLRIIDNTGQLQVVVGLLPDGTYGLAAVDPAGRMVKMSALAFGPKAANVSADAFITSTVFANSTSPIGPTVTDVVVGDTGRCLVTLTASMDVADDSLLMAPEISGPTFVPASDANALRFANRALTQSIGPGISRVLLIEGLDPGTYTMTAKYRVVDNTAPAGVNIYDRVMIVQPF